MTQRYNTGGLVGGSILIGVGVLLLVAQFFNFTAWGSLWPFVIIGVGGLFFVGMFVGGKSAAGFAIPGSIVGVIGLTLLFQNLTGRWNSWAYGWTIILMSVGLGLLIMGYWGDNARQRQSGWRVLQVGFVLFVIFGAFFELVFSGFGGTGPWQAFFPVLMILVGLYLVLKRTGLWPRQPGAPASDSPSAPPAEPPQD